MQGWIETNEGNSQAWNQKYGRIKGNQLWVSREQIEIGVDKYDLSKYQIHHIRSENSILLLSNQARDGITPAEIYIRSNSHAEWFFNLEETKQRNRPVPPESVNRRIQEQPRNENPLNFFSNFLEKVVTGLFTPQIPIEDEFYSSLLVNEINYNNRQRKETEEFIEEFMARFTMHPEKFSGFADGEIMKQFEEEKQVIEEVEKKINQNFFFSIVQLVSFYIFCNSADLQEFLYFSPWFLNLIAIFISFKTYFLSTKSTIQTEVSPVIHAFTRRPIAVFSRYSVNKLLESLKKKNDLIDSKCLILEREKHKEIVVVEQNATFQQIHIIRIKSAKEFAVEIYTNNLRYLPSMIDNIRGNFESEQGIWLKTSWWQTLFGKSPRRIFSPFDALLELISDISNNNQSQNHNNNASQSRGFSEDFVFELFALFLLSFIQQFLVGIEDKENSSSMFARHNLVLLYMQLVTIIAYSKLALRLVHLHLVLADKVIELQGNYDKSNCYYYSIAPIQRKTYKSNMHEAISSRIYELEMVLFGIGLVLTVFISTQDQYFIPIACIPLLKPIIKEYLVIGIINSAQLLIALIEVIINAIVYLFPNKKDQPIKLENENERNPEKSHIECVICLESEEAVIEEDIFRCKNKHLFHKRCISKWKAAGSMSVNSKCPICRVSLAL